ncbi:MAG: hydroxyacid-oxoacid transhydrogenase, partial [Planctomycetota bacterium]
MENETAFNMASSNIRYGPGATLEIGMDLVDMGVEHVMVVTDPNLAKLDFVHAALEVLDKQNIRYTLFDKVRVEPTDKSLTEAIDFAAAQSFDAFVAIGGGSTIDTAKAANLYSTYPADFLDYVNAPIGKAKPIPGPLKPLFAIPTTAGTGSETTGVVIFDLVEMRAKTGIANLKLKPTIGILDPDNTKTLPPQVTASTGLDVLTHAIESYTALPYDQRHKPKRPILRPAYQGSNPISDTWSLEALRLMSKYLLRAFKDPEDIEARGMMLLAASYGGIGFGNAGLHLA